MPALEHLSTTFANMTATLNSTVAAIQTEAAVIAAASARGDGVTIEKAVGRINTLAGKLGEVLEPVHAAARAVVAGASAEASAPVEAPTTAPFRPGAGSKSADAAAPDVPGVAALATETDPPAPAATPVAGAASASGPNFPTA